MWWASDPGIQGRGDADIPERCRGQSGTARQNQEPISPPPSPSTPLPPLPPLPLLLPLQPVIPISHPSHQHSVEHGARRVAPLPLIEPQVHHNERRHHAPLPRLPVQLPPSPRNTAACSWPPAVAATSSCCYCSPISSRLGFISICGLGAQLVSAGGTVAADSGRGGVRGEVSFYARGHRGVARSFKSWGRGVRCPEHLVVCVQVF